MAENTANWKKTLWEKEKLLVTSNFSFSYGVFWIHVKTRACWEKVNKYASARQNPHKPSAKLQKRLRAPSEGLDNPFTIVAPLSITAEPLLVLSASPYPNRNTRSFCNNFNRTIQKGLHVTKKLFSSQCDIQVS